MIRRRFAVVACLLFVAALSVARAEDQKQAEIAKAQVRVMVDGKPLETGRIFFYGEANGFLGTDLNREGKGTIDRIFVGDYVITVEGVGIPVKYSQVVASPLRVKIAAGANEFDFELKTK